MLLRGIRSAALLSMLVRSRRLELPRPFGHSDLNAARLPVPPRPHVHEKWAAKAARLARRRLYQRPGAGATPLLPSRSGTGLNDLFTIGAARRYTASMLLLSLIAASIAAEPAPPARAGLAVQASATVRIISGQRLKLGEPTGEAELRRTQLRDADGRLNPASLIEFP